MTYVTERWSWGKVFPIKYFDAGFSEESHSEAEIAIGRFESLRSDTRPKALQIASPNRYTNRDSLIV